LAKNLLNRTVHTHYTTHVSVSGEHRKVAREVGSSVYQKKTFSTHTTVVAILFVSHRN
jgi:hypothetical protein